MLNRTRTNLIAACIAVAAAVQFVQAQNANSSSTIFNSITKEEIELLLKDVAVSNPDALKKMADPVSRQAQIDSLKQLLAFASQAQKDGLADVQINSYELENIRSEIKAVSYDREINKGKGPMPPFGFIPDSQVKAFWTADGKAKARDEDFENYLHTKLQLLKVSDPTMSDRVITEEEREQARDNYAKIKIYDAEYEARRNTFPKGFRDKVDLQIKLQQAQFLARLFSEKLVKNMKVTDSEIDGYIAKHPELDTSQKKEKAEKILGRVKAGEDFGKLADEFSDDPGNKGADGKLRGGLYQNVTIGMMVPPFERAALALKPGEISPGLVESDFGYHIIKLEKKGPSADDPKSEVYDVRHILVSTTYSDPGRPGRNVPIHTYVREKLEAQKEKQTVDELIKTNNIHVAEDFVLPEVSSKTATIKKAPLLKKRKAVRKRN